MLLLTRHIGEAIIIGDNVSIRVLNINGSIVKLGIDAPIEISVHREEIYQRIKNGFEPKNKYNHEPDNKEE